MKKSIIWFLTIIMALTFIGLLYVQIMYMENMIKMRNEQFSEMVKRSLYNVSATLEQDETKYFLEKNLLEYVAKSDDFNDTNMPVLQDIKHKSSKKGHENNLSDSIKNIPLLYNENNKVYKNNNDKEHSILKGQYIYQKGLLNDVVLDILSQSSNRPISERADSSKVKKYLISELNNNGIELPFEYSLTNRNESSIYKSSGFLPTEKNKIYSQVLFPNDPSNQINYLKIYFPTMNKYIFSSIKFLIPSFAFTFILLFVFIYTIIIAFKQKKLTEMKNDFINNMTHEFKTPISTISLAAQMLNDDSVRKSSGMLSHISTVINDETKRLRFQVEKVLQMSMFDHQKSTLRLQELDANKVIYNVVHTFKIKVEKYGGKIDSKLDANNALINVDEMHFTNVVFSLLDNAVKYRKEDVPLLLTISTRELQNDKLEIVISDNGIGIKKDDAKKIFEKFYRVSTGNRHDVKGFGLGLAYVRKMILEFKGDIRVESEFNEGTKFIITLPLT